MNMVLTCVNNPQSYECSVYGMLIMLANKHSSMLSEQRECLENGKTLLIVSHIWNDTQKKSARQLESWPCVVPWTSAAGWPPWCMSFQALRMENSEIWEFSRSEAKNKSTESEESPADGPERQLAGAPEYPLRCWRFDLQKDVLAQSNEPEGPKGRTGDDLTATIGHPIVDWIWLVFFVFPTLKMAENTVKMVMWCAEERFQYRDVKRLCT